MDQDTSVSVPPSTAFNILEAVAEHMPDTKLKPAELAQLGRLWFGEHTAQVEQLPSKVVSAFLVLRSTLIPAHSAAVVTNGPFFLPTAWRDSSWFFENQNSPATALGIFRGGSSSVLVGGPSLMHSSVEGQRFNLVVFIGDGVEGDLLASRATRIATWPEFPNLVLRIGRLT